MPLAVLKVDPYVVHQLTDIIRPCLLDFSCLSLASNNSLMWTQRDSQQYGYGTLGTIRIYMNVITSSSHLDDVSG
jgi:hypothetical protein